MALIDKVRISSIDLKNSKSPCETLEIPSTVSNKLSVVSDLKNPIILEGNPMVYSLIIPKKEDFCCCWTKYSLSDVTPSIFFKGDANNSFLKVALSKTLP